VRAEGVEGIRNFFLHQKTVPDPLPLMGGSVPCGESDCGMSPAEQRSGTNFSGMDQERCGVKLSLENAATF